MIRPLKLAQKGFTLVELLVATAITGILIVVIMSFMSDSLVQINMSDKRADMLQDAHVALDAAVGDIRLSSHAIENNRWEDEFAPGAPSNGFSWQSNASTLILDTAALDDERNVIFEDPLHYTSYKNNRIYFVRDNVLYRRTLAAPIDNNSADTTCPDTADVVDCPSDSVLARNVSAFTVRYFDAQNTEVPPVAARSVELTLTLHTEPYGRPIDATYTTRTVFRNE